ncbi:DUF2191 domain-containing protein [Streptomyces sp. BE133]|uniref:DUF2191 domain-containing protein n=1 Tax=Streptomyces sp. BE133 TaxID=3002523 RepID=UPI002E76F7C0|nr:DUF2191 domain-containing protein [Streptomyces sp. BE133]MEE1811734.1 DUF2191 domain-containing protein [Streptomyces sp. BE133]
MAEATAGPDAELVVEVTVLAQDTVERVVRDYVARGRRTGARTAAREESLREADVRPQDQQG